MTAFIGPMTFRLHSHFRHATIDTAPWEIAELETAQSDLTASVEHLYVPRAYLYLQISIINSRGSSRMNIPSVLEFLRHRSRQAYMTFPLGPLC